MYIGKSVKEKYYVRKWICSKKSERYILTTMCLFSNKSKFWPFPYSNEWHLTLKNKEILDLNLRIIQNWGYEEKTYQEEMRLQLSHSKKNYIKEK